MEARICFLMAPVGTACISQLTILNTAFLELERGALGHLPGVGVVQESSALVSPPKVTLSSSGHTEPFLPPWNTRYSPILTHLCFSPDFPAQGQGVMRLALTPLFSNLALTPQRVMVASVGKMKRQRQADG